MFSPRPGAGRLVGRGGGGRRGKGAEGSQVCWGAEDRGVPGSGEGPGEKSAGSREGVRHWRSWRPGGEGLSARPEEARRGGGFNFKEVCAGQGKGRREEKGGWMVKGVGEGVVHRGG